MNMPSRYNPEVPLIELAWYITSFMKKHAEKLKTGLLQRESLEECPLDDLGRCKCYVDFYGATHLVAASSCATDGDTSEIGFIRDYRV